jgi:hypothetical protein
MGDSSNASPGFIQEETLWSGSPARELVSTAAYRLGVDIGGWWKSIRTVTGWDNPHWPSDPPEIMA